MLSGLLSDFFEKVLAKLQEKVWDCDLEATKAYYRAKLEKKDETAEDRRRPELLVLVRVALRVLQPARVPAHAPALGVRLVLPAVHVVGLVLQGLLRAAAGEDRRRGGLLLGVPQRVPFRLPPRLPLRLPFRVPLRLPLRVRVGEVALTGTGRGTVRDLAWIDGFFRGGARPRVRALRGRGPDPAAEPGATG